MEEHLTFHDKPKNIIIFPDLNDLSQKAAAFVSRFLCQQGKQKPALSVALAGGTTPKRLYENLSRKPVQEDIPWDRIHFFWGDERCVPPDDPQSNFRMAYETLLSKNPIPQNNVHRMVVESDPPEIAAFRYEQDLRKFFDPSPSGWPRFDLVLLGIGSDGHTASLFPESAVLYEKKRWVRSVYVQRSHSNRLTLTLPVINHAAQIIFLAAGREKAPVFKSLTDREKSSDLFPFQMVQPVQGRLTFFLDREAASLMDLSH